jgi:hypothetical protein
MIRQGRLPEAEKVRTGEGRVWAIPATSIPGIAERAGLTVDLTESIDLRDAEAPDDAETDSIDAAAAAAETESWRLEPVPSETVAVDTGYEVTSIAVDFPAQSDEEPEALSSAGTAIESIGSEAAVEGQGAPSLADVLDTALLEKLLGAHEEKTKALVQAERQRTEYEALAARQLDVERRFEDVDSQRVELAERLHSESVARAIADARVTELRDQLQREITYAEAERYERRQALARETKAAAEMADAKARLGWWARRKLNRSE